MKTLCLVLGLLALELAGCSDRGYRLGGMGGTGAESDGTGGAPGGAAGETTGRDARASTGGNAGVSGSGSFPAGPAGRAGAGGSDSGAAGGSITWPPEGQGGTAGGTLGPPLNSDVVQIVAEPTDVRFLVADEVSVYFNTSEGDLWRIDHSGAGRARLAEDSSSFLVADATHIYWAPDSALRRIAKAGGEAETVATLKSAPGPDGPSATMWLALDESYVYASTYEARTVVRAPKTGGAPQTIARSADIMGGLEVSGGALFWADYASSGGVYRTDLQTGDTALFHPTGSVAMRAVGSDLWLTPLANENWIVRAPFAGGPSTQFAFGGYTTLFESDGIHIYWLWDGLRRLHVTTGVPELVARLDILLSGSVAITRAWVFMSDTWSQAGIYRARKPDP